MLLKKLSKSIDFVPINYENEFDSNKRKLKRPVQKTIHSSSESAIKDTLRLHSHPLSALHLFSLLVKMHKRSRETHGRKKNAYPIRHTCPPTFPQNSNSPSYIPLAISRNVIIAHPDRVCCPLSASPRAMPRVGGRFHLRALLWSSPCDSFSRSHSAARGRGPQRHYCCARVIYHVFAEFSAVLWILHVVRGCLDDFLGNIQ